MPGIPPPPRRGCRDIAPLDFIRVGFLKSAAVFSVSVSSRISPPASVSLFWRGHVFTVTLFPSAFDVSPKRAEICVNYPKQTYAPRATADRVPRSKMMRNENFGKAFLRRNLMLGPIQFGNPLGAQRRHGSSGNVNEAKLLTRIKGPEKYRVASPHLPMFLTIKAR